MGRYSYTNRLEADGLNKVSVVLLKKHGLLEPNSTKNFIEVTWTHNISGRKSSIGMHTSTVDDDMHVEFYYTVSKDSGEKRNYNYKAFLTPTTCYFGGCRYWFVCPLISNGVVCNRRVATLYLVNEYFGCRHCHNLTYASRKLSGIWKDMGVIVNIPELDEIESKLKTRYYNGKITRKYNSFLKKNEKSNRRLYYMYNWFNRRNTKPIT